MGNEIDEGWQLMSIAQLEANWNLVIGSLPHWHICALSDGTITGKGHKNSLDRKSDGSNLGHKLVVMKPK